VRLLPPPDRRSYCADRFSLRAGGIIDLPDRHHHSHIWMLSLKMLLN
jgi:hypothetical protein